ncbi:hypothetical protein F5Y12DRAFT_797732 [Xylaria sp. FL1777]|nr:hypothetical protein F5Y12DRAFT_797732 [Xylaria sp. FL1777]
MDTTTESSSAHLVMTTLDEYFANTRREQQLILDACSSGDIELLQHCFDRHGVRPGSKPIPMDVAGDDSSQTEEQEMFTESIIPPADELLERAVAARQTTLVKFILLTYPSLSLSQNHGIVRAVLENPDAEILHYLCKHDHTFASLSIDYGFRTFLTDACALPPAQAVPILHVLLDNGADVNDGWGSGGGGLYAAIVGHQPVEIISKMVSKDAIVGTTVIDAAIQGGDADIVRALLSSGQISQNVAVKKCIELAEMQGDEEITRIVKDWAKSRTKGAVKRPKKNWWDLRALLPWYLLDLSKKKAKV